MTREEFLDIASYIRNIIKDTPWFQHIYIVGGAVRDFYMGNDIKDIDLVIDLPDGGVNFANWCKEHGYTSNVVLYETYGTAMFHLHQFPDEEIECVMTRGEKYLDNGSRNPVVEFNTIEEDTIRRDFTINSLYYNCSTGEILDMVGGKKDIDNHIIKATNPNPNLIMIEDPLRILRAIRFCSRYGWEIDKETLNAMKRNAKRLQIITKERIQAELNKILMCRNAVMGINLIHQIGAMKYVLPVFEKCYGLEQNAFHFGDVAQHTLAVLDHHCQLFEPNLPERLACLLHDIGKVYTQTVKDGKIHFYDHETVGADIVEDILRDLKYDNETIKEVQFLIKYHMTLKTAGDGGRKVKDKTLNKLLYKCKTYERFCSLMRIIECDNLSHKEGCCIYDQYRELTEKVRNSETHMKMFGYKLPVTGNDIMETLGIGPGPIIAEINNRLLKKAFLDPGISRGRCLQLLPGLKKEVENYLKELV